MNSPFNKISLLVYFISFFLPVFSNAGYRGYHAFIYVTAYFDQPVLLICWLSNIAFAITFFLPAGSWKKFFFALTAIVFSFGLVAQRHIVGIGEPDLQRNGAQALYGIGYILWISAFAITLIGSITDLNKRITKESHGYH